MSKEIENCVKSEWGGHAYFSSFNSQSRGVAIFMPKNFPVKVLDKFSDKNGNILALLLEIENKQILIQGVYGPNRDEPDFYTNECFKKINEWDPNHIICVGDWNIPLKPDIDTLNYNNYNNPRARAELQKKILEFDLLDIFRELNPTERKYTWKQWGAQKYSRLDYFLTSSSLVPYIKKIEILPSCFSDHYPITLEVDFANFTRGRGFWKLNNSLLYDKVYVDLVKTTIKRVVCQYASIEKENIIFENVTEETLDEIFTDLTPEALQMFKLKINPELFLETLMMEIRRTSILYSAQKKRERNATEQLLNHDIEILENELQKGNNSEILKAEIERKKSALEEIIKYQAQGAFIRSRAEYKVEGEKPTRLFCSLEKYNGVQKYVPQLIVSDENGNEKIINDQKSVETEICSFYKKLFQNKDNLIQINSIDEFLGPENCNNIPKLSEAQKAGMNGIITVEEMTNYLKKCKNNVAPGSSGFTNEFYKFFWRDIRYFVINSIEYVFNNNKLPITQRLGIINIIPKGDKDKRFLTNWRPLTLLNTLYKLVSGCIAERIKPVLPYIIHPDQKGFVAGRYIGEAVRTTYDILEYAKNKNIAGLLLTVDFEKAYDSISFKFITKCLKFFNFSEDLIRWVSILLRDFKAVINHCGNISQGFNIGRGCRQGDPIASYLFILCIEILAHKLRSDVNVEGIELHEDREGIENRDNDIKHLIEIYADDLTAFLKPSSKNLRSVVSILECFFKLSGLKISMQKTKAVWFGSKIGSNEILCPDLELKWVTKFTLLGIEFDNALEQMNKNFNDKIDIIEKMLNNWSFRYLTPFGKVTIVKSLGLSKLSHLALVLPNPTKEMIRRIESLFYKFIWGGKSEKVRREDTKLPVKYGGLGMPDINNFWTAFHFSWFRRLLTSQSFWPQILLKSIFKITNTNLTICQLMQLGASKLVEISKKLSNPFWKEVLKSSHSISVGMLFCFPQKLIYSPLFYNPLVVRNRVVKPTDFPELIRVGNNLSNFFYPGTNNLMEYDDFKTRFGIDISQEKFIDVRYTIKRAISKLKMAHNRLNCANFPDKPILIDVALSINKGCSIYYKLLRKVINLNNKIFLRDSKWHLEIGQQFSIQFWNNARKLCASINFDNYLKWLQYQIVRNSLQTNYIVSHFKPEVSATCSYCDSENSLEKISHLFWSCPRVSEFLEEVFRFITSTGINFDPSRENFLFGFFNENFFEPKNYISLVTKKYIWITKFKSANLSLVGFKCFLKSYVVDLEIVFEMKKRPDNFQEWITLLHSL